MIDKLISWAYDKFEFGLELLFTFIEIPENYTPTYFIDRAPVEDISDDDE